MAGASHKKIAQENARILRNLSYGFFGVNAFYVLLRVIYWYDSFTLWMAVKYATTLGLSLFLWYQLVSIGTPRYRPDGMVERPGDNLSAAGLTEYMFDVIYLSWFVHVLGVFFEAAWYIYLLIPIYAVYWLWTTFLGPYFAASGGEVDDPMLSKRQQKRQQQQEKGKVKYYRR